MQNSVTFFLLLLRSLNTPILKQTRTKVKICSALFCLQESLFCNKIVLCTLGSPPGGQHPRVPIRTGKRRILIWTPGPRPPQGPLVYSALFCYQIMTLIYNIVHYIVLVRLVFKLVNLDLKLEKNYTILPNIHPCPFDPYMPTKQESCCCRPFHTLRSSRYGLHRYMIGTGSPVLVVISTYCTIVDTNCMHAPMQRFETAALLLLASPQTVQFQV